MSEAKKRNPAIVGYGLSWSFPAWVQDPLSNEQVEYTISWLTGAVRHHGYNVQYIGVWNEQHWSTDYVKRLRKALDGAGFKNVGIVVPDGGWISAELLKSDPEFAAAVAVVGAHYPGASTSPAELRAMENLTLWSSEDSSTYFDNTGGGCWARVLNWNWVVGEMTSTIIWNVVNAILEGLRWFGDSLLDASQPWSGYYAIKSPIWATAHTTQFASPGWLYLRNNSGSGFLPGGGSYVTLVSDRKASNFSIVIETFRKENSLCIRSNPQYKWTVLDRQNVTFVLRKVSGGRPLPTVLHLWASTFFGEKTFFFEKQDDIQVNADGAFQLTVSANSVYSLTTTEGQQKGQFASPPSPASFPIRIRKTSKTTPLTRCRNTSVTNVDRLPLFIAILVNEDKILLCSRWSRLCHLAGTHRSVRANSRWRFLVTGPRQTIMSQSTCALWTWRIRQQQSIPTSLLE